MKDLLGSLNVQGFVFDLQAPLDKAPAIEGFPIKLEDPLTLVAAVSKDRSINALFDELSRLNIKVKSMRNEANRLEELFIEMVNSNEK
jgi:ABC-2 type transport system ATP-binding protein